MGTVGIFTCLVFAMALVGNGVAKDKGKGESGNYGNQGVPIFPLLPFTITAQAHFQPHMLPPALQNMFYGGGGGGGGYGGYRAPSQQGYNRQPQQGSY